MIPPQRFLLHCFVSFKFETKTILHPYIEVDPPILVEILLSFTFVKGDSYTQVFANFCLYFNIIFVPVW